MMLESFTLASETDEAVFRVSNDPLMTMSCYSENIYPFGIFPQKKLRHLEFDDITIFCGGNGSGKSTLLNLIARKIGLGHASPYNDTPFFEKYLSLCSYTPRHPPAAPEGSCVVTSDDVFESLLKARRRNENTGRLRDELFQRYTKLKDNPDGFNGFRSLEDIDILKEHNEAVRMTRSRFISGRMTPEDPLRSNGESAFAIFTERIRENALYLLDEPENSLSAHRQIELASLIRKAAKYYKCQFIISTHSVFLLAIKQAKIYDLDENPVDVKPWTQLKISQLYHDFFKRHDDEFDDD